MTEAARISRLCTVRNCGLPLQDMERLFRCELGHSFDVANSGYVNLLQPQDRKSLHPGDSREVVLARRRFLDEGHGDALRDALLAEIEKMGTSRAVLDLGCGEGFYLASVERQFGLESHGVDISTSAIDLASRRYTLPFWTIANADRRLPYPSSSFDLILSVTARHNRLEAARMLLPGGVLLIVVPGADDLIEIREAVLGEGIRRDRTDTTVTAYAPEFELDSIRPVIARNAMSAQSVRDAARLTYRGGRTSENQKVLELPAMLVTVSQTILRFRRAGG